jgi:hypothetical protein
MKGRMVLAALWVLPEWIFDRLPTSFHAAVEREIYDGLTEREWFDKALRELQALNARVKP